MHKKGQTGILSFLFGLIIFIIIWAVWLGAEIQSWSNAAVDAGTVTGVEAFLITNINLWIGIFLLVVIGLVTYLGSG